MNKVIEEIVKLEKIVGGGQAIGSLSDGKKVFAWGGLPGETVKVQFTKIKRSYVESFVVEVLEPSELRVQPLDSDSYLSTSPWQIMEFETEQAFKKQLVEEAFSLSQVKTPTVLDVMTDSRIYGYRNKMEYSLWWDNDSARISLAFHMRGSHQKLPISKSSIEMPEIFNEATRIIDNLNDRQESARKYQSLLIRSDQSGKVSGSLFEKFQSHPIMDNLTDTLLGNQYSYSPNGFFQINLPVYEMSLKEMMKYIKSEKVIDMYSGVGTIGLSIARDRNLTLIETDKSAYGEMLKNIPLELRNIHPVCAKSEDALGYITNDATIILDPPRAGLHDSVVNRILEAKPQQIIYLSCNPVTQARDIKPLSEDYQIEVVQPFNFFPRTPHIENLVVLARKI